MICWTLWLRALQEKKFHRVGGNEEIPVDVRVVCATNRDLEAMVHQKKFRQDLFYRINVFPIFIPPLRQRKDDIVPIAEYLISTFLFCNNHVLTEGACRKLKEYPWPGNVRELANVLERCLILTRDSRQITADTLSFLQVAGKDSVHHIRIRLPANGIPLEKVQMSLVKQALVAAGNNQTTAAKLLGLSRSKFRVLLKNLTDFLVMAGFLAPFYFDELFTMVVRIKNKDSLVEPHRKHIYQVLVNEAGIRHWKVSSGYGLAQLVIGFSAMALHAEGAGLLLTLYLFYGLIFGVFSIFIRQRFPSSEN